MKTPRQTHSMMNEDNMQTNSPFKQSLTHATTNTTLKAIHKRAQQIESQAKPNQGLYRLFNTNTHLNNTVNQFIIENSTS